jgi:hypothetical protein
VCFQSYLELTAAPETISGPSNEIVARPTNFQLKTRFPGLELVVIGALLETVGYFGTRLRRGPQKFKLMHYLLTLPVN